MVIEPLELLDTALSGAVLRRDGSGVGGLIDGVEPGSLAEEAGIRAGMRLSQLRFVQGSPVAGDDQRVVAVELGREYVGGGGIDQGRQLGALSGMDLCQVLIVITMLQVIEPATEQTLAQYRRVRKPE